MSIINIVGFETGDTSEASSISGTGSVQSTIQHSGSYALRCNPTGAGTGYVNVQAHGVSGLKSYPVVPALYSRFYFYAATLPASGTEEIYATGINAWAVRISSGGILSVYDAAPTLLATGTTVLGINTWYRIEVKTVTNGTTYTWEVTIDGTSEISGSFSSAIGSVGPPIFGKSSNRNSQSVDFYYDDIALSDSAYPGAGAVAVLKPRAAGTYTAWTNTYTEVDEIPPNSDTDYVNTSTNTNAETELVDSSATGGVSGTINAVKSYVLVRNASGGALLMKHRVRVTSPSALDTDLTAVDPASAYVPLAKVMIVNPQGGAAWTTTALDTIEPGVVHAQSQAREARCTWMGVMVDFTVAAPSAGPPPGGLALLGVGR